MRTNGATWQASRSKMHAKEEDKDLNAIQENYGILCARQSNYECMQQVYLCAV